MSVRIRYKKTDMDNTIQSVRSYYHPESNDRFIVRLNVDKITFKIFNDSNGTEVASSAKPSTSLHKLKIAAKDALTGLGVSFDVEGRADRVVSTVSE